MNSGFAEALWLVPLATGLHVLDEWPGFPRWARRFASPRYSDREYLVIHAFAIAIAAAVPLLFLLFPGRISAYAIVTLVVGPALLCNAVFHAGASLVTKTTCSGVVTGIAVYLPLSFILLRLALSEGLVSGSGLLVALTVAALWHAAEVGHSVFKRW